MAVYCHWKKVLIPLLILAVLLAFNVPALAAKGGKPPPEPVPPVITSGDQVLSTEVDQVLPFQVTAKSKNASAITWAAEPDLPELSLDRVVYNKKAGTSTAYYTFISAVPGSFTFSIIAVDGLLQSEPVTVSITVSGTSPPPTDLNYLVLGDSIAAGTDNQSIREAIITQIEANSTLLGLLSDIQDLTAHPEQYLTGASYRYTYQFRDFLAQTTGQTIILTDLSVAGYTTADLLVQVQANIPVIEQADVITLSIGGNDILAAGSASGFSQIDSTQFSSIYNAISANLGTTLAIIRAANPSAQILLMNFFNLYHPLEQSPLGYSLYSVADSFLSTGSNSIGALYASLANQYDLVLADTYSLFEAVNFGPSATATADTYAALSPLNNPPYVMDPIAYFPARFKTSAGPAVAAPFNAWPSYQSEWAELAAAGFAVDEFSPDTAGVAIDLYTHFYNPDHYVFGHDEASSDLIQIIKAKYGWFAWLLFGGSVLDAIEPFEQWRDVHCTALGHSLIAKAHIEAWNQEG